MSQIPVAGQAGRRRHRGTARHGARGGARRRERRRRRRAERSLRSALRLPHAGRPDLRQLLRHVLLARTGSGRDLPAAGDRRSHGEVRQAVRAGQRPSGRRWARVARSSRDQWDGGKMDGFSSRRLPAAGPRRCHGDRATTTQPSCPSTGKRRRTTCCSTASSPRSGTASGQPLLLGRGQPGTRQAPAGYPPRLREPADDLRPAASGRRELEVLRPGLQPRADLPVGVAGQLGNPDRPGAARRLPAVHP